MFRNVTEPRHTRPSETTAGIKAPRNGSMNHYLLLLFKEVCDVLLSRNDLPDLPMCLLNDVNNASLFAYRRYGQSL